MSRTTLETFWTENVQETEGYTRTDSLLEGIPWIISLPDTRIPENSHRTVSCSDPGIVRDNWSRKFPKRTCCAIDRGSREPPSGGSADAKRPMTYDRLGEFITLRKFPEKMLKNVKKLDLQRAAAYWTKLRDLRQTSIQFLLQKNPFRMGENEKMERDENIAAKWEACHRSLI